MIKKGMDEAKDKFDNAMEVAQFEMVTGLAAPEALRDSDEKAPPDDDEDKSMIHDAIEKTQAVLDETHREIRLD